MASSYRSIQPAPSRDGAFRKSPQERVASKRTGLVKSACWECRKRKAKCNGLKPLCGNCAKWGAECIYDSDVRESKVRNLQDANEKLQTELQAAKILLRQVASGSDHVRSVVLKSLDNAKEPFEILQVLGNDEGSDQMASKAEGEEKIGGSILTSVPVLPSQQVRSSEDYSMLNSSMDNGFGDTPMLYTPLYQAFSNKFEGCPEYNASLMGGFGQANLQPLQASNVMADSSNSIHSNDNTRAISRQPGSRSLFFEPLFNHTDYYLTTTASTTGQSLQNSHQGTMNHSGTESLISPDGSLSSGYPPVPSFDGSNQSKSTDQVRLNSEQMSTSSLRVHPNLRNHFNNLSLSSSIRANGYPRNIQEAQIRNIFVPNWAAASLNTAPDPGGLQDAFGDIYKHATGLIKGGEPMHHIAGHHPNIAALYDQQEFDRSCLLSQWAARMVHSVKRQGYDFTCFASMNVFWYMMRWIIDPSPESYAALPEWIRPTSNQLFTPHISMADFVLWPGFRELVVQLPQLQERMAWLADMSMFIKCDWPYPLEQALYRNPVSGNVDLVDLAKQHVWTLGCWSVGPSFRKFVTNADSYLLIRPEEESGGA